MFPMKMYFVILDIHGILIAQINWEYNKHLIASFYFIGKNIHLFQVFFYDSVQSCSGFFYMICLELIFALFNLYVVASKDEAEAGAGHQINPIDLNHFFGEDGKIYGYQSLKVTLTCIYPSSLLTIYPFIGSCWIPKSLVMPLITFYCVYDG